MDDLKAVRELLATPPPSAEAVADGRARLVAATTTTAVTVTARARRGRRTAGWSALATGLLGAAAVALVFGTAAPQPPNPPPSARQVLLAAAEEALDEPDRGTWWGSRLIRGHEFFDPGGRYLLRQTRQEEIWIPIDREEPHWRSDRYLGVAPATPGDERAWRADGSPATWTYTGTRPGMPTGAPEGEVSAAPGETRTVRDEDWDFRVMPGGDKGLAGMRDLPTTPEGLRELWAGVPDDRALAERATALLVYSPVTSRTRAAAYRLLASLPQVSVAGRVTDPLGRVGEAVEYPGTGEAVSYAGTAPVRVRLVINPATGAPLALESRVTATGAGHRTGQLLAFTVVQESTWADANPLKENS